MSILEIISLGNISLSPGKTIMMLKRKYKKFAPSVAIPTPTSPIFGIRRIFKTTLAIPDVNFIINSI